MRVLTVTNMYPYPGDVRYGIFVKEQVESIRSRGVEVDVLFVNARTGSLRHKAYVAGVPRLWATLARKRYDLIHAHYVFSGVIARAQWQAPLVLTHHGVELRDRFQGALARATRNWPREVIVVAPWMVHALGRHDAHVIPCGVDLSLFRPMDRQEARRMLGLSAEARYILFAGYAWDPIKRYHLAQAAAELVRSGDPDVELLTISGEPHERIPLYMNAADVFVMTSSVEGSAQVVKEAMACNLPIVATDAGDNWDVIGEVPGCYRTSEDPTEIAGHLKESLSPPRRTAGRSRVERFGIGATAGAVVSVYRKALERSGRAPQGRDVGVL